MQAGFLTGQSEVLEIAIAAGNTESARIFWGGEFNTGSSEYQFNPAATPVSGNVYIASYLTAKTGALFYEAQSTSGPSGPTGPEAGTGGLVEGLSGALVATNYSGLVIPEYEPHFVYDVHDFADYEFSVRTLVQGAATPFSVPLRFTSGDIVGGITGAGFATGLFDGATRSGVAVYDPDQDNLNISQYVTLDDAGIPVQIEKAGTSNEKETLLLLKAATSNRPSIQFSEAGSDTAGMSLEYYGVGSDNAIHLNPQSAANPPVAKFFNAGNTNLAGDCWYQEL